MSVIDLGAAPGSWSQYLSKNIKNAKLLAIDLTDVEKIDGVKIITGDFTEEASKKKGGYRPGRGRYTISRKRCKQKRTGKSGSHVVSYTDHYGNLRTACHTSPKKAKRQVKKIEKWLKSTLREESLRRFIRECLIELE